jgi:hypothetical protein
MRGPLDDKDEIWNWSTRGRLRWDMFRLWNEELQTFDHTKMGSQHTCNVTKELIVMLVLLCTIDIKELAKLCAKY